jgi:hypothetical protein
MTDYRELREHLLAPMRTGKPVDLTDDPDRRFRRPVKCDECGGTGEIVAVFDGYEAFGCPSCESTGTPPAAPADPEPAEAHRAALGDCPAFALAEQHAHDAAARLAPWGITPPTRVVWRVGHVRSATVGSPFRDLFPNSSTLNALFGPLHARWSRELAGCDRDLGLGDWGTDPDRELGEVRTVAQRHLRWETAAAAGLRFPADMPAAVADRAVADLPNPYGPVLDVWRTGFALETVTRDEIRLYAPRPVAH